MLKNFLISLIIGLATIFILSGCLNQNQPTEKKEQPDTNIYTMTEISQHNNTDDCWLVISGRVYNVTNYIQAHPGGKTILEGCGQDATQLFETRPMGSGTPHSQRAKNLLDNYYIGNLSSNQ